MKEQIAKIKENAISEIENSKTLQELNDVRGVTIIDERKYGRANLIFVKKRGNI